MFGWLRRIGRALFRRESQRVSARRVPAGEGTNTSVDPRTVIFCAPAYDEATQMIGDWLGNILLPEGVVSHSAIGENVTRDRVNKMLHETNGTSRVKVFGGHGSDDALLGPVYDECKAISVDGLEFAVLYDEHSAWEGPGSLFAFCCKSARKLGPHFASGEGRAFLGYSGNIGYDLENEECQSIWRQIIEMACGEIIRDGAIFPKHEELLINLYDDAIDYFRNGQGKGNDRDLETVILLMKHKKFLRRIGGSP